MKKNLFALFLLLTGSAFAGLYLKPQAGATVPVNGDDPSFAIGGAVGYQMFSLLSIEGSYARLVNMDNNGVEGDLYKGTGILSTPMGLVKPYASVGLGALRTTAAGNSDWTKMTLFGAGLNLTKLGPISVGAGVEYALVYDGQDFVQPHASVGFSF